jgi:hypothetical protein
METPRNRDDRLAEELRALRPTPRPEFTAKLDERAAAGFPRRSRLPFPSLRLADLQPRRLLLPAGAVALLAIVVATAVVASRETGDNEPAGQVTLHTLSRPAQEPAGRSGNADDSNLYSEKATAESAEGNSGIQFEAKAPVAPSTAAAQAESSPVEPRHRAVERSAEIVLGAAPEDVDEDSSQVFEAVHAHDGIVMRSSTREGKAGQADARFELLIPSDRLRDALAAISAIDEVRSRHEATTDITAPTVSTGELLRDSKARIDSLLAQLEDAETESERKAVEPELLQERRHRARLRANLQHLQRRADLSRVLIRIETGTAEAPSSGGTWGIDDALHDAGKILAGAAAVTVVALAILAPIALIALLAWLTHRAWVRRERRRVLS